MTVTTQRSSSYSGLDFVCPEIVRPKIVSIDFFKRMLFASIKIFNHCPAWDVSWMSIVELRPVP